MSSSPRPLMVPPGRVSLNRPPMIASTRVDESSSARFFTRVSAYATSAMACVEGRKEGRKEGRTAL